MGLGILVVGVLRPVTETGVAVYLQPHSAAEDPPEPDVLPEDDSARIRGERRAKRTVDGLHHIHLSCLSYQIKTIYFYSGLKFTVCTV